MGIFSFLFGKKNEKEENVENIKTETVLLKYTSDSPVEPTKESENRVLDKGEQEKVAEVKVSPKKRRPDVSVHSLDGCEQLIYEIDTPKSAAAALLTLGTPNPDYKLDVLTLRKKGYLFKNIYAYKFDKMDAVLTVDSEFQDDPDAVRVSVNGVDIGYLLGSTGARVSWLIESGRVRRVKADISGGDYLTLDCDPEYDETSKRIPRDCLYTDEEFEEYSVTVFIDVEKHDLAESKIAKQKTVFPGVITKALPGCKQQRFQIAGERYHMDEILSLGTFNKDFLLSKSDLYCKEFVNVPIVKYTFPSVETQIVPEPNNPNDKNAIKVMMNGKLVGYIPKKRCEQLLKDMASRKVVRVQGGIVCGDIRMLCAVNGTEENSRIDEYRIDRVDGGITVKVFIDTLTES